MLLLHLLALLLATVGFSVVNVSVACTIAVAMAVIVTVMYVLWFHACSSIAMTTTVSSTMKRFFSILACRATCTCQSLPEFVPM